MKIAKDNKASILPFGSPDTARAVSTAEVRLVHTEKVTGSNPVPPTTFTTTQRGDIAELMAAAELARRGYTVARPLTNGAPYDLIIDDGLRLYKVQVKKGRRIEDGGIICPLRGSKSHRGRQSIRYHDTCDMVLIALCDESLFFIISGVDLTMHEIRLRDRATLNNQSKGIRNAIEYALDKKFPFRK